MDGMRTEKRGMKEVSKVLCMQ